MLETLDWIVLAVYLLGTLGIGVWSSRRQSSESDYYMAGRSVHAWIAAVSLFATLMSTTSFVSVPSEGFRFGVIMFLGSLGYAVFTPLAVGTFVTTFYGKGENSTLYQYLGRRFDYRVRALAATAFLISRLLYVATACYAGAKLFDAMAGWNMQGTILSMIAFTTVYTTLGGMRGVMLTDLMQTIVMLLGVVIVWCFLSSLVGHNYAAVWTFANEHERGFNRMFTAEFYQLDLRERTTFWALLLVYSILRPFQDYGADQLVVQRLLSAKSPAEAKRAAYIKAAISVPIMAAFYGLGLLLFYYYNHVAKLPADLEADKVFPYFVSTTLPAPLPGLLAAAMMAALMSTISSVLSSLATVTSIDFLQPWGAQPKSDAGKVMLGRGLTLLWGAVAVGVSLALLHKGETIRNSIMEIGQIILSLWGVVLVVVLAGARTRWATANAAAVAMIVGMAVGTLVPYYAYFKTPESNRISFLWLGIPGIAVTAALVIVLSLFERSFQRTPK